MFSMVWLAACGTGGGPERQASTPEGRARFTGAPGEVQSIYARGHCVFELDKGESHLVIAKETGLEFGRCAFSVSDYDGLLGGFHGVPYGIADGDVVPLVAVLREVAGDMVNQRQEGGPCCHVGPFASAIGHEQQHLAGAVLSLDDVWISGIAVV